MNHNQKMISTKIIITNFCEKLRKLLFIFFSKIKAIKDIWKKMIGKS